MDLPEGRRDLRPQSSTYGAVAVLMADGQYAYATADRGCGFASAKEVQDWSVIGDDSDD